MSSNNARFGHRRALLHDRRMTSLSLSRRSFLAAAAALPAMGSSAKVPGLVVIEAPSNLGLRPLRLAHIPGAWRAPEVLRAGIHRVLRPSRVDRLTRPTYALDAEPLSRIRNATAIRKFGETLAVSVATALATGEFPVVIGGDCSILLGCLAGAKARQSIGLIHVDGHSDFYHPGNYDTAARLGSAAGMDLALATGRGEPVLARWSGASLVEDAFVVQIGERDELDRNYDYADIARTAIRRIPVRRALLLGMRRTVAQALSPVEGERRPLWLHVDVDVLDGKIMPAVDSPGSPGLTFSQLAELIALFQASGRLLGMNVTIYDPDLDPDHRFARGIVDCIGAGLRPEGRKKGKAK